MDRKRKGHERRLPRGFLKRNYVLITIAAIVIVIFIIIIAIVLTMKGKEILGPADPDRIECPGLTEENCTKMLCMWDKVDTGPSCFMKKDSFGYEVYKVTKEDDGPKIQLKSLSYETPYGMSIENIEFKVTYLTENILRFQFKDSDKERYEVPAQEQFPLLKNPPEVNKDNLSYEITYSNESQVFHFVVKRADGTNIWDTRIGGLMLSDQYLQIASYLPSENVYGLGEHVHDTLKHRMDFMSWPMFARDLAALPNGDRRNLYGVHPFYTCLEKSGKSHGVLFLNSNAMEATLMPWPAISFRTIGGILDFFIFVGDNPEHVIQLYTSLIGRPMMPPYWSLGFQLSRYGYGRISEVEAVLNRTRQAQIPQAVQYLDIDHMYKQMDFTYDNESFPELPELIAKMKNERDLKWIIILDPGIAADKSYAPYTSGLEQSIYIKRYPTWTPSMFPNSSADLNITFGRVWPPTYVAFPDFLLEETKEWWKDNIVKHHEIISFDGLWIDMNEPSNFETNEKSPEACDVEELGEEECWSLMCPYSRHEYPPYNPLLSTGNTKRMSEKTLCMESIQGNDSSPFLHYDVHSLYGWSQTQPTLEAAQIATSTRSIVITRSSYPSSGRWAGHWLGDNHSTFTDLKRSIIGMLEFNLFGIPYVGADVCGFFRDTSPELCKRWMQLGAFYPFYRNHNAKEQRDQDPAVLGPEVQEASRKAVERRITLNPYLYTLFYKAHVTGSTVVRPVFHEFPNDSITWDMDTQFMWGNALLIIPILEEKRKSVPIYLPKGEWWNFKEEESWKQPYTERYVIETNADEYTPIYVRGGVIFPMGTYDPDNYPENSTTRNIILYVFPFEGKASGDLFIDDGISIDTIENEAYALYQFTSTNCTLEISSEEKPGFSGPNPVLEKVVVFKVAEVASVSNNYNFTMNAERNSAVITVTDEMKNVQEIKWEASDGSCQMIT